VCRGPATEVRAAPLPDCQATKWLRAWLEERDIFYMMAIRCSDTLTTPAGERRADELIAAVPPRAWQTISAGPGRTARASTTGHGSRCGPAGSAAAGTGCWPAARSATSGRSPITPATGPAGPAPPTWPGPRAAGGTSKMHPAGQRRGRARPLPGPHLARLGRPHHLVHARPGLARRQPCRGAKRGPAPATPA
jgi:hypothetical protein